MSEPDPVGPRSFGHLRAYHPPLTNSGPQPVLPVRPFQEVVERVRGGLDAHAFETVRRRLGLSIPELARLLGLVPVAGASFDSDDLGEWTDGGVIAAPDTAANDAPMQEGWICRGASADRLDELDRLGELAVTILGDEAAAARWFASRLGALGGARPVDFLDVRMLRARVRDVLYAIEYGHVS